MKWPKPCLAALVLLTVACGTSVKVTRLTATLFAPTTVCEVFTTSTPDRPFTELALIEVYEGGSSLARKKAMQMGADAIILRTSSINGPQGLVRDTAYKMVFAAIKWK